MQYIKLPSSSGTSPSDITAAIEAALAAFFSTDTIGVKFHNAVTNNITPAFAEVAGAGNGTIPAGTKQIQISSIVGKPIQLGFGANAGAAVAWVNLVAGGGPITMPIQFTAADIICVRTLDGSTVSTNYFVLNFLG